jgi:hypothetical protein
MSAYLSSHVPQLMLLVKEPPYFISNGPTPDMCRRLSGHFCLLLRSGPKPCLAALWYLQTDSYLRNILISPNLQHCLRDVLS